MWVGTTTLLEIFLRSGRQTFDEVVVGLGPAVAMVCGQDPNGLLVGLEGGIPNLLQLEKDLVGGQRTAVTAVNVELKELERKERKGTIIHNKALRHRPFCLE